jgi:acetyltransferase-like isoleucine patch superfamily enzyme
MGVDLKNMLITPMLIREATGLGDVPDKTFENLGLLNSPLIGLLSFIEDEKYFTPLSENRGLQGVFTTAALAARLKSTPVTAILCDDPRYFYYTLYNYRAKTNYRKTPSRIHSSVVIHPRAYVSEYNVSIGENSIVEPNATVLPDVVIGRDCRVGAGSVLGCEEAEIKRTSRGIFRIIHDGRLVIGDRVDICSNCTIDKGFYLADTAIGNDTKIASTTLIGHSVRVGERCLLLCCTLLGSAVIEDDVRINPGAIVVNQMNVGRNAEVSVGAVVVQPVPAGSRVSGPLAIDHGQFMHRYAKLFGPF